MKSVIMVLLGIILGTICINCARLTMVSLISFALIDMLISALFCVGAGLLTVKCFKNV